MGRVSRSDERGQNGICLKFKRFVGVRIAVKNGRD